MDTARIAPGKGILSGLMRRMAGLRSALPAPLHDGKSFESELFRERVRAARYGSSYVVLHLSMIPGGDISALYALCQAAALRCRTSDTVGLHGDGVGLLLPETAKDDVPAIVASIEETFHNRLVRYYGPRRLLPDIECKVFFSLSEAERHPASDTMQGAG